MVILSISDSHEAHACVISEGKIISAIAEERFSRLKADMGYPKHSIEAALSIANLDPKDIDVVAFAGKNFMPFQALYKMNALFSVKDWISQCYQYWGPVLIDGKSLSPLDDFEMFKHLRGQELFQDPYYEFIKKLSKSAEKDIFKIFREVRSETVQKHLGISKDKIHFYRHEDCHKIYGLYSRPNHLKRATIITIEGKGDDSSATLSSFENNKVNEIWSSNGVNLGRLYRYVTLILGMKPTQHEYKVMGLAPYGTDYHGKFSLEFFNSLSKIEEYKILPTNKVKDLYFSVKKALEGERFDGIAWGLQKHLELILENWVKNCIIKTNINDVVISGGVGQNIKACKHILDSIDLGSLWAGPICGDGSLGIGAGFLAFRQFGDKNNLEGLKTIYLGTQYTNHYINNVVRSKKINQSFFIYKKPNAKKTASWLSKGLVCARFSGRMEFGQRALGNRSILADPRRHDTIEKINKKIKYRDFWMPFTPTMTVNACKKLIDNPKNIFSPYMTIAFDLNSGVAEKIPAVIHPSDKTVRPQMLNKKDNPAYYSIIEEFGKLTGIECLLNTSFNLHGDAIVETPEQAIDTFLNSEIDILLFDDVAISRVNLKEE